MNSNVSVIIPTYNRSKELGEALESVLAQTVKAQEIIVVNDGDATCLRNVEDRFSGRFQLIHTGGKKGGNYARNMGADLAQGEILMFLDDDDTWREDKIEKQLKVFRQNPEVGLVYSGKNVVFDTNREEIKYKISVRLEGNCYKEILKRNFIGTTSSVAVRSELFNTVGGFDESLPAMQDYELWIRICKIAKVGTDKEHLVYYTVNRSAKNQISKSGTAQLQASNIILERYAQEFLDNGISLNRRRGRFYFNVAKSKRKNGLQHSMKWIVKSFFLDPSIRTLFLMITSERLR